jgi:long-chain acyl-CoA synthetase
MQVDTSIGAKTIPELFFTRAREFGSQEALRFKRDGSWHSISWSEYADTVRRLAGGIADWVYPGDIVCILSENRPEWCFTDLAVESLGGVPAPIYASNPPKDVAYILDDTAATLLFVSNAAQLDKIRKLRSEGRIAKLERVVTFDEVETQEPWVVSLSSVLQRNADQPDPIPERLAPVRSEDMATLIYTSGTTGEPKGVMLSHRNVLSNVRGGHQLVDALDLPERRMLSFLPLAHSLERTAGFYVAIEFGFTLAFAESLAKMPENLREVQPTVLISVPRIYEKFYAKIHESASGWLHKTLLSWAVDVGRRHARELLEGRNPSGLLQLEHRVADALVLHKIRAAFGGKLRYAISGGGPLPREIGEFFHAIGLTIFEGYGLTESSPVITANRPGALRFGAVGKVWPDVEIKIEPEPGRDKDGEVLARGPNIMLGYYKKPKATLETVDPEGWLHTGDIGFIDADGFLHITDRKKDLIKTSGGKYVAPQPIENRLKLEPFVDQAIVIGDRRKYCVALLVPHLDVLSKMLGHPVPAPGVELNSDPEVQNVIQGVLDETNKDLGSWEQIKRVYLLPGELSQESGELTPTLKVKRRVVDEKFKDLIDSLYS